MVVPSFENIIPSDKVLHKVYQVPYKPGVLEDYLIQLEFEGHWLQLLLRMGEVLASLCESVLNNTEVMEELKGFDLIIHNTFAFCGALLGERFNIPRVEIMPAAPNVPTGLNHKIPAPVSYVPQLFTEFTDKMTFVERAMNLGVYLSMKLLMNIAFNRPMDALKVKYRIKPERNFQEAVSEAELVLITADFALEYAQPLLPGREWGR